ncbi:MAG: diacylglycerol kinase family protein [Anaerolineaceae bacterium]|nr:diacylglycerol kinase family protein [Anaerolineaceae bacterium]
MIFDFLKSRIRSFKYAFAGIAELWRKEKNTRIHMFFTIIVIIAAFLLKVSSVEFCILIFIIGAVWCAEAVNSAVERVVDLVTSEKKPLAKAAKDLAAGAVLILAITSVFIGLIIFLPKILAFLY